jgi:hypothetical protein
MKRRSLRSLALVVLTVAALVSFNAGAAHAAKPTVETVPFNFTQIVPAGALCSFDVVFTGTGTITMTTYYDNSGAPVRQSIHGALLHTLSGPAGSLSTNGPAPVHIDLITGTSTDTGNEYHFNLAGHGVVLAATGRLVVDSSGNIILQTGYTVSPDRIAALCAVLGP